MDEIKSNHKYFIGNIFYENILSNLYEGVYFVDHDRKILYWNKGAETITGYRSEEVIGKRCNDNINHVDNNGIQLCIATCPLSKTIADLIPRELEVYLLHKKGHRIPVLARTIPIQEAQGNIVGAAEIFNDNSPKIAIAQRMKELERMALLDPLTGLANRRYIEMKLQSRFDEMSRYGWSFGVLFMDVDHFKGVNDAYGHSIGDTVLKTIARTLMNNVRASDIVGRWGGDEFIAVNITNNEKVLYSVANKLRALVEQSSISIGPNTIRVTISIGATLAMHNDTVDALMKRADGLMYQSKVAGRNRISINYQ
ncbi:MAG TPA: diguanylate cyclase [Candidatus Brocadiaceae bacterium]